MSLNYLFAFLLLPSAIFACGGRCVNVSVQTMHIDELNDYQYIFEGKVIGIEYIIRPEYEALRAKPFYIENTLVKNRQLPEFDTKLTIQVLIPYKGKKLKQKFTLLVKPNFESHRCNYIAFKKNHSYLFFLQDASFEITHDALFYHANASTYTKEDAISMEMKLDEIAKTHAQVVKLLETFSNAKKDEICKFYRLDGSLDAEGTIENEKKQGKWTYYSDTEENIYETGSYSNGLKSGEWLHYCFFKHNLEERIVYENTEADGKAWTYINGKLRYLDEYKNGLSHGQQIHYWENGKIERTYECKKDNFDGEYLMYDENGNLLSRTVYKKGAPQS